MEAAECRDEGGLYMNADVESKNTHGQSPNPDGRFEGPINDSFPDAGRQMGVRIDIDPTLEKQPPNPFHATPQVDPGMKKLRNLMNAKEV